LSPLRDADAVIESAKALCAREHYVLSGEECSALSVGLKTERRQSEEVADIPRLRTRVTKNLGRVAKSVKKMKWKQLKFRDVSDELRKGYKQARRDMRRARERGRAEDFHAWRKSVKTLWYGLRLLEQRAPVNQHVSDLRTLETLLGDDHNLVVLDLVVNRNRTAGAIVDVAPRLTRLSSARRAELEKEALALGRRILSRRPKPFERGLNRLGTPSGRLPRKSRPNA
jgi:CHAD domain